MKTKMNFADLVILDINNSLNNIVTTRQRADVYRLLDHVKNMTDRAMAMLKPELLEKQVNEYFPETSEKVVSGTREASVKVAKMTKDEIKSFGTGGVKCQE